MPRGAAGAVPERGLADARNHKALRYQITPANVVFSTAWTLTHDGQKSLKPRAIIGEGRAWSLAPEGGRVIVVVVGETVQGRQLGAVRLWRDTTPGLWALLGQGLVSFPRCQSCGHQHRDLAAVHVRPGAGPITTKSASAAARACFMCWPAAGRCPGSTTKAAAKGSARGAWKSDSCAMRSPQSCEGGLPRRRPVGRCWTRVASGPGAQAGHDQLIVPYMLGNHGPSTSGATPDAFRRFTPVCESDDLACCSQDQIVNA